MIEAAKPYIDPRLIPDDALARFRKLAVTRVLDTAPTFGQWLEKWCETEEYWRATDPDNRPARHVVGLPPAHEWNNRDLGQALRAITYVSMMRLHGSLDELVDRMTLSISELAAERLEANQ